MPKIFHFRYKVNLKSFLNNYVQCKKQLKQVNLYLNILLYSIKLIISIDDLYITFSAGNKLNKIKSSQHPKLLENIQKECINFIKTIRKDDNENTA